MSEVNTQETEAPTQVKRGRGRPKGSKNKPKPEGYVKPVKEKVVVDEAAPAAVASVVKTVVTAFVPTDAEEVVEAEAETVEG